MPRTNFGKNIRLVPRVFYTPKSEQEVLEILSRHRGQRIRSVGRLHSWSKVIEADEVLLDLRHLNQVIPEADRESPSVVVGAGCQIKRLLGELQRTHGWTLPSVGFITEQTIAGAVSTGTHGSGRHSLSHYVTAVRIARYRHGTGEPVIEDIDGGDALRAARCSLGCLGVILSVRMQCRVAYAVEEHFEEYDRLGDIIASEGKYPQQQFFLVPWRWTYFAQHRRESDQPASKFLSFYQWYRFFALDVAMHMLILIALRLLQLPLFIRALFRWVLPTFVIRGWRVVGPSESQLVMQHDLFRHVELELFVRRSQLDPALHYLKWALTVAGGSRVGANAEFVAELTAKGLAEDFRRLAKTYCHHYPICIRKICLDDTLISMACAGHSMPGIDGAPDHCATVIEEPWYSITLTNYQRGRQRERFERLASFLAHSMATRYGARPHWGKLCPLSPEELRRLYPKFPAFQEICQRADPEHAFTNDWTQSLLGGDREAEERLPSTTV